MKKFRFSEEQISYVLKQAEAGESLSDIFRKMGTSQNSFYQWRSKHHGMGVSELRKMWQLEEENR